MNIRIQDLVYADLVLSTRQTQLDVLCLRNQRSIRELSIRETVISEEEHWSWISSLKNNPERKVWVVQALDRVIGVCSLSNIDMTNRNATVGWYVDTELHGSGIGLALAHHLLQNCFDAYGLERVEGEVISTNIAALQFNKSLGFHVEGVRRSCIVRQGLRVDIFMVGMLKAEWILAQPRIEKILQFLKDRKISD